MTRFSLRPNFALLAAIATVLCVFLLPVSAGAKPVPKKKTELVLFTFSCSPAYGECSALGGINAADACRGRTVTMLFNGKKIGSTRSDGAIGSFEIENVPFAGAGRYTIRVETKHAAGVTCKQASVSGVVDENGGDTFGA
jgi:hypothetical protein